MTETQTAITEQMLFFQEYSTTKNEIQSYKHSTDGLSVTFTLQDRQIKVTLDEARDLYNVQVWKLLDNGEPDLTYKDTSEGVFVDGLLYFFDVDFIDLEFEPTKAEESNYIRQ
jgi:hypothetical protein